MSSSPRCRNLTTLYRPVGPRELASILLAGSRRFPPRRPEQPIFYPVTNFEYAATIAREWNAPSAAVGFAGWVTQFDIDTDFVSRYPLQLAGGRMCEELWVPAEELDMFNDHIQGLIVTTAVWYGEAFNGWPGESDLLLGLNGREQLELLGELPPDDLEREIAANPTAIPINYTWWRGLGTHAKVLSDVARLWRGATPLIELG